MTGVADGTPLTRSLDALSTAMRDQGWVTEEPVGHLGPKLEAWLAGQGRGRWTNVTAVAEERWLIVSAEWNRADGRMRDLRADAYALIGSFVEDGAYIVQRRAAGVVEFEVATGQEGGEFAPHGHLVRLRVMGRDVERVLGGVR